MALEKIEDEIKTGIIECFEYFFETISNFKIRPTIEKMKIQEGIQKRYRKYRDKIFEKSSNSYIRI